LQTPELLIPETTLKRETFSCKEIYLHDLKLLDYRAYRSRPSVTTKQMVLTGTPANVGDAAINGDEEPEWKDVEIPYIDYLEKTMELFAKGYNKKALSRFQTILEAYPDDVNAGFYAGICYYNLKEYDQAERSLRICINSKYSNFYEEAEWYLAKNLLAQGNRDKGVELLRAISNAKGYYAKQADAELRRL
jgi:tetratricopeptide (TPR) repeat protein